MPKRTDARQRLVYMVKAHFNDESGFTVTESKLLPNLRTGQLREVDVLLEGAVNGEPVVVAFEVRGTGRKLDVTAAEGIIGKYDELPINNCVIVSWSGFTRGALDLIGARSPRFAAVTPIVEAAPPGELAALRLQQWRIDIREIGTLVERPDLVRQVFRSGPSDAIGVFNIDGDPLNVSIAQMAVQLVTGDANRERLMRQIVGRPEADFGHRFELAKDAPLFVQWELDDVDELHAILAIVVEGTVYSTIDTVSFASLILGDQRVAVTEGTARGRPFAMGPADA